MVIAIARWPKASPSQMSKAAYGWRVLQRLWTSQLLLLPLHGQFKFGIIAQRSSLASTSTPASLTTETTKATASPSATSVPVQLSTAAKVAIGVVVPLVSITVFFGVFQYLRRIKTRKVATSQHYGNAAPDGAGVFWRAEMDAETNFLHTNGIEASHSPTPRSWSRFYADMWNRR